MFDETILMFIDSRLFLVLMLECFFDEDGNENPDKSYDSDVGLQQPV